VLTSRGRRTIALGLVAGLGGRILGVPELFGLAAAAVVVSLAALVRVRAATNAVLVTALAVPDIVEVGEPAYLELSVEDASGAGSFVTSLVLLSDEAHASGLPQPERVIIPRLSRGERAQVRFALPTQRRGLVDAGAYEASVTDPLGLARRRIATSRAARCTVLPRLEPLAAVVPRGASYAVGENTRSAAERLIAGSSTLRRYGEGDDPRLVHWRTTARVGELMVRDGADREDPEQITTVVLLDTGGEAMPPSDLERAVEVTASVLGAAAECSNTGISGAYRLVTTGGLDTGELEGYGDLREALVALAGVRATMASPGRFATAARRLRRSERAEVLVIIGAFGDSLPERVFLEDMAAFYSPVVLVTVGAGRASSPVGQWQGETVPAGVLLVSAPLGRSLSVAWGLDLGGRDLGDERATHVDTTSVATR
jgi:hypothetical protein